MLRSFFKGFKALFKSFEGFEAEGKSLSTRSLLREGLRILQFFNTIPCAIALQEPTDNNRDLEQCWLVYSQLMTNLEWM